MDHEHLLFGSTEGDNNEQDAVEQLAASLKMEFSAGPAAPPPPAAAAPHHAPAAHHPHPPAAPSAVPSYQPHHSQQQGVPQQQPGAPRPATAAHSIGAGLPTSMGAPVGSGMQGAPSTPTHAPSTPQHGMLQQQQQPGPPTGAPTGPGGVGPQGGTPGKQVPSPQAILQHHVTRYRKGEVTAEQLRASLAQAFSPKIADDVVARCVTQKRPGAPGPAPGGVAPGQPKPPGVPGQPTPGTPGQAMGRPMPAGMTGMPQQGAPGQQIARPGQPQGTPMGGIPMHVKLQPAGGQAGAGGVPQQQSAEGVSVTQLRQGNLYNPQLQAIKITSGEDAQKYAAYYAAKNAGTTSVTINPGGVTPGQPPAKKPRIDTPGAPPGGVLSPQAGMPSMGTPGGTPGGALAQKKAAPPKKAEPLDDKFNVKDITDVTRMAGFNLKEETASLLPTYSTAGGEERAHAPDEVQSPFINKGALHKKVTEIAAKHGIKKVSEELYEFLALAAQNRLRDVVDELGNISKQRLDFYKDEMKIEITSDPRKQLKLIEKREKEEKERRDAEEKERALKDKKMDPEKKKSDQARLEEEEKIRTRTANLTALQAIGDVRPRRAMQGGTPTAPGGAAGGAGRGGAPGLGLPPDLRAPLFNKQMLDQLTALQKLKAASQLTPQQAQQLEQLLNQLRRMQQFKQLADQLAGRKVPMMLDPKTGRLTVATGALQPRSRFDTRVITMKDLEFYLLHKDPHTKYSKLVWRLEKRKRSASLLAAQQPNQ